MRAIVLAAGMGSRLGQHTADKPKCLVHLAGKTLLEHQLEALRAVTNDIVIVRGYQAEKINYPGIHYIDNIEFKSNNMVASLMIARDVFVGDCIVCYSDILYEPSILHQMGSTDCSIGVVVDTDFREYWAERPGGITDHESLRLENDTKILEIGKPALSAEGIDARYVGLLKFDQQGIDAFKRVFDQHHTLHGATERPWYNSQSFRKACMTDMIQALIDDSIEVSAIRIQRGWLEVDTDQDLAAYQEWMRVGTMGRFFKP